MKVLSSPISRNYNCSKINFSGNPQNVVKQTALKSSTSEVVDSILALFNKNPEQLPNHISPIVSKSSNRILGITTKTKKGNDLSVIKVIGTNVRQGLRYLAFSEKNSNGKKLNAISIDLETNEFLKLGFDSKPVVKEDNVYYYSKEDLKLKGISKKFVEYVNLIFNNSAENSVKQNVVLVNKKGHKIIEQAERESLIDEKVLKQLDKEFKNKFDVISADENPSIDCTI